QCFQKAKVLQNNYIKILIIIINLFKFRAKWRKLFKRTAERAGISIYYSSLLLQGYRKNRISLRSLHLKRNPAEAGQAGGE
ncbi:MAG: hypothetical protein U9N83_12885, partial [Thermodesulfobacteriota bacterium]|nr:hypothetical protein [Thermodesulfobacteriota bacterium]